jgi:hypothetical protein
MSTLFYLSQFNIPTIKDLHYKAKTHQTQLEYKNQRSVNEAHPSIFVSGFLSFCADPQLIWHIIKEGKHLLLTT